MCVCVGECVYVWVGVHVADAMGGEYVLTV